MIPTVPAPPETAASEWFDVNDRPWRFIYGRKHIVTKGTDDPWHTGEISVQAAACQYPSGRLTDPEDAERPGVKVEIYTDDRLTLDQARRLSAALLAAADEAEGWPE